MRTSIHLSVLCTSLLLGVACKKDPPVKEDLGSFVTGDDELTPDIPFTVGEGSQSVLVACDWSSSDLGTAWQIKGPSGSLYYTNEFHDSYAVKPMRSGTFESYLPILIPVSPDAPLQAGDWTLQVWVAGPSGQEVQCTKVERTEEVPETALVDVNFVIVGVNGVNADNAEDNNAVQSMIESLDEIWSRAGLGLGDVTFSNFSGNVDKFAVIDNDSSEPGELYSTVANSELPALTIFLVQDIESADGALIEGVAAGPPGAATLGKTQMSGMIVNGGALLDDPGRVAQVAAHEGGHFLGLFHTTEKSDDIATIIHDPLSDTAECTTKNDQGLYAPSGCPDSENLMFWAPPPSSPNNLSDDQSWVLRRNPATL